MMHLERPFSSRPFVLNDVRASLVTGLLCFLLAFGTLHLTSDGKSIATVWPSNAVILAMLMLRPKASWWPIVTVGTLGHIVAALFTRPGWEGSVMFAVANDMEVLLAAWAIRKTSNSGGLAGSWQNIACFALWARSPDLHAVSVCALWW
jgi:integral membrane sensor domain MASE1